MYNTALFYSGILANLDLAKIASEHSSGPHNDILADFYVANDVGRFADKS
jgi:hypothetical protein